MAKVEVENLKPNSHKYHDEVKREESAKPSREKIKPVVDRKSVVSTKKSLGKKFSETFLKEDLGEVRDWLIFDMIIPGLKNAALDMLSMVFFGETRSRDYRRDRDDRRTNYRSYYKSSNSRDSRSSRRDSRRDHDDRVDIRDIVLRYRDDAERVVDEMAERIRKNDSVSVADLLDLIGETSKYTDNDYGWKDERDIRIRRVSSGYLIDVPEPEYLE